MGDTCTIQIHLGGAWRDAATVSLLGEARLGARVRTYVDYVPTYAFENLDRRDAAAISASLPVTLGGVGLPGWPGILYDLIPQGHARRALLQHLKMPAEARQEADWPLLMAGAGNPIGNARVKEAREWLDGHAPASAPRGYSREDIAHRDERFVEDLHAQGAIAPGGSSAQGEWPKILLTQAADGLLYPDHVVRDGEASAHWLIKFSREAGQGSAARLNMILRAEAVYMRIAHRLGLRVHRPGDMRMEGSALFVPRFDRAVAGNSVVRHAQESIAALCGKADPEGPQPTHNEAVAAIAAVATRPLAEVAEYVKRDIVNVALGNKDNHARNTALARREDGAIALAPMYDFAPMGLHPDGIARRMRWERDDGGRPDWRSVICQAAEATNLGERNLARAVGTLAQPLQNLGKHLDSLGLDEEVVEYVRPALRAVAEQVRAFAPARARGHDGPTL